MTYENPLGGHYDVGILNAVPDILKDREPQQQPVEANEDDAMVAARFADLFARYAMIGVNVPKSSVLYTIKRTWESISPEQRQKVIALYYRSSVFPRAKEVQRIFAENPELKEAIMSEVKSNRKNNPSVENKIVMKNTLLGGAIGVLAPLPLLAVKKVKKPWVAAASAIGGMIGIGIGHGVGTAKAMQYMKKHPTSVIGVAKQRGILGDGNK